MRRIGVTCCLLLLMASVSLGKEEIPANIVAGKQVEADAKIGVGTKLVGIWDKKNYLVEVIEIKRDKQIRIHWIGFDKSEDADVPPSTLYYPADTTQTRKAGASRLPKEYQAYDKNGDGQIGLYEWERSKFAEFKKLDKNHDGFLTPQELAGKAAPPATVATAGTTTGAGATTAAVGTTTVPTTPEIKDPLPNPGNLQIYNGMIGQSFTFNVTGKAEGMVIGTGIFASNSDLAAAAVHAGLVKVGESKSITASMVPSPDSFQGSSSNGVTSSDGSPFTAAFTLK